MKNKAKLLIILSLVILLAVCFLVYEFWPKEKKATATPPQTQKTQQSTEAAIPKKVFKNVALDANGGRATADSYGSYGGYTASPQMGNDGKETFWAGRAVPGWYQIEFDQTYKIEKIRVWTYYHTQTYFVELSEDGNNWTKVVSSYTTKNEKPSGEGENDDKTFEITPTRGKYLKITITASDAPASHIYQTGILEVEAFTCLEG